MLLNSNNIQKRPHFSKYQKISSATIKDSKINMATIVFTGLSCISVFSLIISLQSKSEFYGQNQATTLRQGQNEEEMRDRKSEISNLSAQVQELSKLQKQIENQVSNLILQSNNNTIQVHEIIIKLDNIEKQIDGSLKTQADQQFESKQVAISLAVSQQKIQQLSDNISSLGQLSLSLSDLKNILQLEVKPELDLIKKDIMKTQSDISANQNHFNIQIDQITNKIDIIPLLPPRVDSIEQQLKEIEQISQKFPILNDSVNSLNSKINSDTFNKVEIFGPYLPYHHTNRISVNNSTFSIYQTTKSCILEIKQKAIFTLIATGHAITDGPSHALLTFLKNQQVELQKSEENNWIFGAQIITQQWNQVSLTQEFTVEPGTYEFQIGIQSIFDPQIVYINTVTFVAKVTYIS